MNVDAVKDIMRMLDRAGKLGGKSERPDRKCNLLSGKWSVLSCRTVFKDNGTKLW